MNSVDLLIQKINALELWENSLALKRVEFLKGKDSNDTRVYFVETGS